MHSCCTLKSNQHMLSWLMKRTTAAAVVHVPIRKLQGIWRLTKHTSKNLQRAFKRRWVARAPSTAVLHFFTPHTPMNVAPKHTVAVYIRHTPQQQHLPRPQTTATNQWPRRVLSLRIEKSNSKSDTPHYRSKRE